MPKKKTRLESRIKSFRDRTKQVRRFHGNEALGCYPEDVVVAEIKRACLRYAEGLLINTSKHFDDSQIDYALDHMLKLIETDDQED